MKVNANVSKDIDFIIKIDDKYYKATKGTTSCFNCDLDKLKLSDCSKYCNAIEDTAYVFSIVFKEINKKEL